MKKIGRREQGRRGMGKGLKKRDSSADRTSFRKTVENELYTRVGIKVVVKKIASRKGQVRR